MSKLLNSAAALFIILGMLICPAAIFAEAEQLKGQITVQVHMLPDSFRLLKRRSALHSLTTGSQGFAGTFNIEGHEIADPQSDDLLFIDYSKKSFQLLQTAVFNDKHSQFFRPWLPNIFWHLEGHSAESDEILAADLDRDGVKEFLFYSRNEGSLQQARNLRTSGQQLSEVTAPPFLQNLVIADFNGDSELDLAALDIRSAELCVVLGVFTNQSQEEIRINMQVNTATKLQVVELDASPGSELAVWHAEDAAPELFSVAENTVRRFSVDAFTQVGSTPFFFFDLELDHDTDLLAYQTDLAKWIVIENEGNGNFTSHQVLGGPAYQSSLSAIAGEFFYPNRLTILIWDTENPNDWYVSHFKEPIPMHRIRVSVDAARHGYTNAHGSYVFRDIVPGTYHVRASALGHQFEPNKIEVDLKKGESLTAQFIFKQKIQDKPGPKICINYDSESAYWGEIRNHFLSCAYGSAAMSGGEGSELNNFNCCRLPDSSMFLPDTVWAQAECPEQFVVVGAHSAGFICQKINTEQYRLGPATPAKYWGIGQSFLRQDRLMLSHIPPSLRYSLGRIFLRRYYTDGCVGWPPGSLLVAKLGDKCSQHFYRQLHLWNGSELGAPVQMLPSCSGIDNIFSPYAECRENR